MVWFFINLGFFLFPFPPSHFSQTIYIYTYIYTPPLAGPLSPLSPNYVAAQCRHPNRSAGEDRAFCPLFQLNVVASPLFRLSVALPPPSSLLAAVIPSRVAARELFNKKCFFFTIIFLSLCSTQNQFSKCYPALLTQRHCFHLSCPCIMVILS